MLEVNEFNQIVGNAVPNFVKRPFPSKTESLIGKSCTLEPMDVAKHCKALFDAQWIENKGESWTYLPFGPFKDFGDYHAWALSMLEQTDSVHYVIIDKRTSQPVGSASYLRINPEHGSIEVGNLQFSELMKKSVIATEAMYLMMRHAFDDLQYRRYEWKCNSLNEPSKAAALRFGFTYEGTFRNCNVFKGRNRDTSWFSMIDSEWPEKKTRFENWLHESNFDSDGRQIKKLSEF